MKRRQSDWIASSETSSELMVVNLNGASQSAHAETARISQNTATPEELCFPPPQSWPGGAFLYYLCELRRDEIAPSSTLSDRSSPGGKAAFAGFVSAVVVVVAIEAWFAGSPPRARLLPQDGQRVQDLTTIHSRIEHFYRDKGVLADTLAACDVNPSMFIAHKKDAVTGEPYVYRVVDATHFDVGATFALASPPEKAAFSPAGKIEGPES